MGSSSPGLTNQGDPEAPKGYPPRPPLDNKAVLEVSRLLVFKQKEIDRRGAEAAEDSTQGR